MTITKLDAAERQIVAAVRLLFDGGDPVPIYALAAAAREITTTLCVKRHIRSAIDDFHDLFPEKTRKQMYDWVHAHANFFKHANTDPDDVLHGFEADEAQAVLYLACIDFGRLCEDRPVVEADVFEAWFFAKGDLLEPQEQFGKVLQGLATKSPSEQIKIGKQLLEAARKALIT
jgi:hypothetical protein